MRISQKIADEQALRLLRHSEQPFETDFLHPRGRARFGERKKIEQPARCLDDSHAAQSAEITQAELLFERHAERKPKHVRLQSCDLRYDRGFLGRREISVALSNDAQRR